MIQSVTIEPRPESVAGGEAKPAPATLFGGAERDTYEDTKRWAKKRTKKAVLRRRDMAIRAYVGPNGSFKSATAVMDLLPTLRGMRWHCDNPDHAHTDCPRDEHDEALRNPDGTYAYGSAAVFDGWRLVYSTVLITLPDGSPHPLYRRLNDWKMVLDAEHCDMLFDEVTGIANARDAMSLPRQIQVILDQLRKRDVCLLITAPSFQRMDTTLRTVATGITECRGYFGKAGKGATVTAWKQKRLARARTFAAADFQDWTEGKRERLHPQVVQWWWGPKSEVFVSYSSTGAVARLGQSNDAGACLECGGVRSRPRCTCAH